ncbi:MAG TPA: DinB family protein [Chloroflexota bacterium]|nr:DinB family protein [Chloroflexota bacterium]
MAQSDIASEKQVLESFLNAQRGHVTGILDGLGEDALRRSVLPSGWIPLGLVQHLALDVERFWFRAVIAGEQDVIDHLDDTENAWQVSGDLTAGEIFDLYRDEIARANRIVESTPLDAAPAWWPDFFGTFRLNTVREIVLHVIEETACHAGHLDAARELIDGQRWVVLTE